MDKNELFPKITIFTNQELLDELEQRFDTLIFHGLREKYKKGKDRYTRRWKGEYSSMLGLCDLLIEDIKEDIKQTFNEVNN